MKRFAQVALVLAVLTTTRSGAADTAKTEEDLKREAAIAKFTAKMTGANYPALFDQAAQEFNVQYLSIGGVVVHHQNSHTAQGFVRYDASHLRFVRQEL